ncbi:uncharacterized protein HMPREF1541_02352 [Cyphellophora europaea CBS 101466]|uniref:INO80 complex subunit B-like conserved region domain-containing protein n=1 Tax=Cyphellophora europaea (strain CBS 101466) TaxID=1220924 RepID=W2S569_CYPE1|nr:uncharacterized protein HMPREF1541_02352 [Cyphellophora europaea CBS 101466]ETN43193.1 hypothetical protein HMPREF1541_02352 [Cyphellophora europaea CBS 101466]
MPAFTTFKLKNNQRYNAAHNKILSRVASSPTVSPRSRGRAASGRSSAAISKAGDGKGQSLKLTVKAPPSKLREVMRANELDSLHDTLGGGQVIDGPRRRRNLPPPRASARGSDRPKYVEYDESEIEDDNEEDADHDMDDDAAGEDGDVEMEDAPVPPKAPKITLKPPAKSNARQTNPKVLVTPANVGPLKSVEDQEMEDDPGDEEVEDSSDLSGDDDEEGEQTNLNEDDARGEEEDLENEEDVLGEDDDLDDDDSEDDDSETPASGAATPDPASLTKRQRRAMEGGELMALEMGPQQRKFFTDAEKAMKKDEHARKRKELTKRKIQEEKTAALNRLLKPQASKARGAAPKPETLLMLEKQAGEISVDEEEEVEKADPMYTRWISTKDGVRLGVPEEWLGKSAGRCFGPPLAPSNGALVQELD